MADFFYPGNIPGTTGFPGKRYYSGYPIMKNLCLIALIALGPLFSDAQSIHGLWSGTLTNDSTHRVQNFELGLSEYRGKITGYTYTTFIDNDTFYYSIKRVRAERKDGRLVIEDDEMVANNFPEKASKHVRQTTVFPLINDSTIDISNGRWNTNRTKKYYSIGGSSSITVLQNEQQSDLLAHLQEANISTDLAASKRPAPTQPSMVAKTQTKTLTTASRNANKKTDDKIVNTSPVAAGNDHPAPAETAIEKQGDQTAGVTVQDKTDITQAQKKPGQLPAAPSQQAKTGNPRVSNRDVTRENIKNNNTSDSLRSVATNNPPVQKKKPAENTADVQKETGHAIAKTQSPVQTHATGMATDHNLPQPKQQDNPVMQPPTVAVSTSLPASQQVAAITTPKALPATVGSRKTEAFETVSYTADSLVLSLYDNGIVDGDTVSVFLNGEPVIEKQMLKASATKKTIYMPPAADSVQLVLFAENLGSIPPNTGLLTIRDGEQVYQVRFSADLQKNASVILRRKKK